jgi:hypothetical protein
MVFCQRYVEGQMQIYMRKVCLLYSIIVLYWWWLPTVLFAQHSSIPKRLSDKISPGLLHSSRLDSRQTTRIYVKEPELFRSWLTSTLPGVTFKQNISHAHFFEIFSLSGGQMEVLAACPWVTFIDVANREAKEELSVENADFSLNSITAVHSLFPQVNGKGITISVKERLFDTTDIDFRGRIIRPVSQNPTISTHATTMATLIAGGGNSSVYGKGTAWQSSITSSDFSNLLPDDTQQLQQRGISVQNHSYGVAIENYYGLEAYAYDQQTRLLPQLVHVFSSGNEGTGTSSTGMYATLPGVANLTGQFKMSKNTLSIGATNPAGQLEALSSRGPAYDGRIKPELVAYGDGGTSEAAAIVSGMSALLQQSYREKYGSLPPAALVKAVLINSAYDAGRTGIDYETGFGQSNALGAIRTILENRFSTGVVSHKEKQEFAIQVPEGMQELKVTLTWHDVEAEPNAAKALVNDLDIRVIHQPSGNSWQPWVLNSYPHPDSLQQPARRGIDRLNNVEQVSLLNPPAGTYFLQIEGYAIAEGVQEYSLAYAWETGFEWIHPVANENLEAGKNNIIRWHWKGVSKQAILAFRSTTSPQWLTIGEVDLSQGMYKWVPPDTLFQGQLRLISATQEFISDTFTLQQMPLIEVGYNCEEEVLLQWPAVQGATGYQLFQLGGQYLEPFMLVSDTAVVLSKNTYTNPYVAVVPLQGTLPMGRSSTLNYNSQGTGCYIRSFLARELISDKVLLDLDLTSLYNLHTIVVERWENGSFIPIQTISPVTSLEYELADLSPSSGRNVYRIRAENISKQSVYSQEVPVYYIRAGEVLVFPNPVAQGQLLNIAASENETIQLTLFDLSGKRILSISEIGELKSISTRQLPKGTYILHIHTQSGQLLQTRIVVM